MRITISSPDGLGDFVLRMPFFEALRDAGHDLQIFMRPPALDLAAAVLPAARIEKISEDPYARLVRFRRNPFAVELKKIGAFAPDLLVIALFQHSFFDEICLSKIPKRLRVAGFRSADAFWGTQANTAPQELAERFDMWVEVSTGIPELEKNRLLASAILGSPVPRKPARISPPQKAINDARSILREHKISEGEYWVVCAGSRPGLEIKDWGESNWVAALGQIAPETKAPFLFLGNEAEAASIERILSGLPSGSRHFNLAANPPSILAAFGIIALSAGFVGTRLWSHATGGGVSASDSGHLQRIALGPILPRDRRCRHCLARSAMPRMPRLLSLARTILRSACHRAALPRWMETPPKRAAA